MKKVFSILLAVFMLFCSFTAPTKAANEGSITINGITAGNTYEIYQLLDLESYNVTSGAYSYKVNAKWAGFFATTEALTYVAIDDKGYVTWVDGADEVAFSKAALAYAKANHINPVKSSKNDGEFVITTSAGVTSGKFSDLNLGYYLVDSTMGALCGLTTTNPNASINAKNGSPTIDKQVKEDSTDNWGNKNTADVGQTVEFRVTINVHDGAENYVLHDVMSEGLTFDGITKIEHVIPGTGTTNVPATYYTVKTALGITVDTADDTADGCTFEIVFTKEFTDHLDTNDKVIVYYTAVLNEKAIKYDKETNTSWLDYGENHKTTEDSTETAAHGFDIVKTDSQNTLIDGAEFKIYDAATGGNEVKVVKVTDELYRRAKAGEEGVSIVVKNGKVRVVGFDNGTYYLEETVAPAGYNKLTARQKFIISDGDLDAIFNDGIYSSGSGVHVVNKTGSMLPETGAMGTTLFIICGGAAVLFAGLLLFAKMRMSQLEEK